MALKITTTKSMLNWLVRSIKQHLVLVIILFLVLCISDLLYKLVIYVTGLIELLPSYDLQHSFASWITYITHLLFYYLILSAYYSINGSFLFSLLNMTIALCSSNFIYTAFLFIQLEHSQILNHSQDIDKSILYYLWCNFLNTGFDYFLFLLVVVAFLLFKQPFKNLM